MKRFRDSGFLLKEDIIKVQHRCRATGFWKKRSQEHNFLLIMHEHVFVFYKTAERQRGRDGVKQNGTTPASPHFS
jgi:hypothetical protein